MMTKSTFFIHPAGGSVLCYKYFCDEIGDKRSIFAVDLPENYKNYFNMECLASYYATEILKVHNTTKKIVLGGYSFGGNIAYEIAHQLIEHGLKIEKLVLFDSHPPIAYTALKNNESIDYDLAFSEIVRGIGDKKLAKLSDKELKKYLDKWIYCHRLLKNFEKNYNLAIDYIIFRASEKEKPNILSALQILPLPTREEWKLFLKGNIAFIDVVGNHYSMMTDEHLARELARQFLSQSK